jgi:aspartyl protease family protein
MQRELSSTFKVLIVWLVLGTLVFLGIQAWQRSRQATRFQIDTGVIRIERGADGHYHWPGTVNGRPIDFLIDTGASSTALSLALATELGVVPRGEVWSNTANGTVRGQEASVDVVVCASSGCEWWCCRAWLARCSAWMCWGGCACSNRAACCASARPEGRRGRLAAQLRSARAVLRPAGAVPRSQARRRSA